MQKQWEVTAIWRSDFPSTVCMNSQHSECFKEALWNVSDSHGESLLQLKCFSRSPRYSLWTLLPGKYGGIFLFIYIKWHVNKETVSTCGSLGVSISVHKWELVCAKKRKKLFCEEIKIKTVKIRQRAKIPFASPKIYSFLTQLITQHPRSPRLIDLSR